MKMTCIGKWVVLTGLLFSLGAPQLGQAGIVPAGWDYMLTTGGNENTGVWIGDQTFVALGSLPYSDSRAQSLWGVPQGSGDFVFRTTWTDRHGNQVDADSIHRVNQVTEPVLVNDGRFDTVIRRNNDVSISGVGGQASVSIGIEWLSLKSAAPIALDPLHPNQLFDLYVGVNKAGVEPANGWMTLNSTSASGNTGTIDLGQIGNSADTTRQFNNSLTDLGLPVNWIAYAYLAGTDPVGGPSVVMRGYSIFHNQGLYEVPEPTTLVAGALLLLPLGASMVRKLRRNRTA